MEKNVSGKIKNKNINVTFFAVFFFFFLTVLEIMRGDFQTELILG